MNGHNHKQSSVEGNGKSDYVQSSANQRQVKLQDYFRVLFRGRWVIISSFLIIVLFSLYLTFTTEPVYEASAKLILEEQSGMGESLFDLTTMMKKETMINNQVEILKSRTLAEYVIRDLQISLFADKLRTLGNFPHDVKKKRGFLKKIFWGNGLSEKEAREFKQIDNLVESLRERIHVIPIRNTDIIEIRVRAFSPFEAEFVTNAVAAAYSHLNQEQTQKEIREVKLFLENQMNQYARDLAESEEALKNYKENAKVIALPQETEELVSKAAEFETLYNEARTDMEAAAQRLNYIDTQLNSRHMNFDVETISSRPYLDELKKQIAEKEAEQASYVAQLIELGVYEENKERLKQEFEAPIEALKTKFSQEVAKVAATEFVDPAQIAGSLFTSKIEVETELHALRPKVDAFKKLVDEYNRELNSLPDKSLKLARLLRSAQVDEKIFIMLQEKYQESRITEVGQLGNVRIIDPAKQPKYPVKPNKKLNFFLSVIIGLGLGVAIAFLLEYLDDSIRTIEDVETLGLPLMVAIPYIEPEVVNGVLKHFVSLEDKEAEAINERLVSHLRAKSPVAEAYRTLRTNILFAVPENRKQIIMVTSSGPKEGKSTSVSNLAITFSQMGTKTLLIDADLRRPMVHKLFNIEKSDGLTNVLIGKMKLAHAVQHVKELPNLDILTCGVIPPNPSELLGSRQMSRMLRTAKEKYSIILIDTPPVIAVTDPSVLSPLVDGMILVVRSGITQRDAAVRAIEQLNRVEAPVVGVILNDLKVGDMYGSYYYSYYYYYDSDSGRKRKRVPTLHDDYKPV